MIVHPDESLKLEYGSKAWLDFFARLLAAKISLEDSEPEAKVACEVYYDAPGHLADRAGRIAWTRTIADGIVTVIEGECDEESADVKIVGQYGAFKQLVQMRIGPENLAEFTATAIRFVEEGRIRVVKDNRSHHPPTDTVFHNYLAAITL